MAQKSPGKGVHNEAIQSPPPPQPLVFISHDKRDADIAEAFARLLKAVSGGLLKSFRSSDTKGSQGLEYGREWFPEIKSRLQNATDVICLLTEHSINRPWILFEAGFAKGNNDTPVHGVALGVHLERANTGPFALFQNCSDDIDSLSKLVVQLLRRLPGSEPDEDAIRSNVEQFLGRTTQVLGSLPAESAEPNRDVPDNGRFFEEVKAMFHDVTSSIKHNALNRMPERYEVERLLHLVSGKDYDPIGLIILSSVLPSSFSWLGQLALDLYHKLEGGTLDDPQGELKRLVYLVDICASWAEPGRQDVLRYFSDYILYIASYYGLDPLPPPWEAVSSE